MPFLVRLLLWFQRTGNKMTLLMINPVAFNFFRPSLILCIFLFTTCFIRHYQCWRWEYSIKMWTIKTLCCILSYTSPAITICFSTKRNFFGVHCRGVTFLSFCSLYLSVSFSTNCCQWLKNESLFLGTYYDAVSSDGQGLSDYMLLCSVVATILVIVNTAQVSHIKILKNQTLTLVCSVPFIAQK